MLYNIMLVYAIHQHESATGMHASPPSGTSLPSPTSSHSSRLSQSTGLSSVSQLSVLHVVMCMSCTARRSNQSILMEISSGCSLGGLMLKRKLQYFSHLMGKADSFEKTLMQEEEGTTQNEMAGWHHRLDGHEFE